MSRAYRITIAESLSRHVQVDDGVCSNLELLPILGKGAMGALLSAELEQKGFLREGDHAVRKDPDGITVKVNVESGEVAITVEGHVDLDLETQRTRVILNTNAVDPQLEEQLRAAAKEQLDREAQAEEEALRRKVTAQLEAKLKDLKEELDAVVNKVTASALKKRAGELGTVEEIHEDGSGNLTIKVRI